MMMLHKGLDLAVERELRGITLESLSKDSRYSVTQLRDVEAGRFERFSNDLVVRGIIRMYVEKLGLDHQMVMLEVKFQSNGSVDRNTAEPPKRTMLKIFRERTIRPVAGFFSLTLILLILIWPKNEDVHRTRIDQPRNTQEINPVEKTVAESSFNRWSMAGIALDHSVMDTDQIPTVSGIVGNIRLIALSPTWVRIKYFEQGIESLMVIFPGESRSIDLTGEIIVTAEKTDAIRCIEAQSGHEIRLPADSVIRFLPRNDHYIIQ